MDAQQIPSYYIAQQLNQKRMDNSLIRSLRSAKPRINITRTSGATKKQIADLLKWKIHNEDGWSILWNDHAISIQTLKTMNCSQRINHFPGMSELSRKNRLGKNLNAMRKMHAEVRILHKQEYDFYPRTWTLPLNYNDLILYNQQYPDRTLIVKPEAGCQGKGIFLTNRPEELQGRTGLIVQEYLEKPYLIDNLKFDFRIYVLLTCINPLRVYVYEEGLVRFATESKILWNSAWQKPDRQNLKNNFSHLTNYAINKDSEKFKSDDQNFNTGHKRSLKAVMKQIGSPQLWTNIHELIIKTIICAHPEIANQYRLAQPHHNDLCFQLLGFDIILTEDLKPMILEVNHTPSFNIDTQLDKQVKKNLIMDTLKMVHPTENDFLELKDAQPPQDKMKIKDAREMANLGGFVRIYPCQNIEDTEKYDQFFKSSLILYHKKYGTNIVRGQKKVFKEQDEPVFVPKLNLQKDLFKVYNNAGHLTRFNRQSKMQKKDTVACRYEDERPQSPFQQKATYTNYKKISNIYGRREVLSTGYKMNRSGHYK